MAADYTAYTDHQPTNAGDGAYMEENPCVLASRYMRNPVLGL